MANTLWTNWDCFYDWDFCTLYLFIDNRKKFYTKGRISICGLRAYRMDWNYFRYFKLLYELKLVG